MSNKPRILAFSGSARKESLNRKLLGQAMEATRAAGSDVTLIDLNEYAMPLYHGDRTGWIWMMKEAISKIAYYFNSQRMMRRYAREAYIR